MVMRCDGLRRTCGNVEQQAVHTALCSTSGACAGGESSAGPVALLSGLNPQPYYLVKHFFSVALFGMSRLPLRKGLYGIWLAFMLLVTAVNIILPIVNAEGIRCEKRPHMHCMHALL
jgi:hypothetical protein